MKVIYQTPEEFLAKIQEGAHYEGPGVPDIWCDLGANGDWKTGLYQIRYSFAYFDKSGDKYVCTEHIHLIEGQSIILEKLGLQMPPPGFKLIKK